MNQETHNNGQNGAEPVYPEDEISLVDLWIVLMRRKRVVAVITVLFVIAGIAFWATKSRQERYVTSIEIGRIMAEDGSMQRIEAREAVETRLRNAILPSLRNQVAAEFDTELNALPAMEIRVPEEQEDSTGNAGDFVFLETTVNPEKKELVEALHQGIVDRLAAVHDRRFNIYKKQFSMRLSQREIDLQELMDKDRFRLRVLQAKSRLETAKNNLEKKQETFPIEQQKRRHELERLADALEAEKDAFAVKKQNLEHKIRRANDRLEMLGNDRDRLEKRLDRVSVEKDLLDAQMGDIRKWMNDARESQQDLYEGVEEDTNMALAALMLGNQAENARKRLSDLQRRLSIELPERRSEIEARLGENERKILETRETAAELKTELEKLKQDHARDISEKERNIARLEDAIEKAASDHQRAVEAAERKIERLKIELKNLEASHQRDIERKKQEIALFETEGERMEATQAPAVVVPAETIGRGGVKIGVLSLVLGLMVGVFGAFFSEFLATARQTAQEREENHNLSGSGM